MYVSTYFLDLNNLSLQDGDFCKSSEWEYLISTNRGSFIKENQNMIFTYLGFEIQICYDLIISGHSYFDRGDSITPPFQESFITDVDIQITDVYIDEYQVELTNDIISMLLAVINKSL